MVEALIALGSNVGDRLAHLQAAVRVLAKTIEIEAVSKVYESAPMYVTDQPAFLNAALRARTTLSPVGLLQLLKSTEAEIGRQARERFGPREVDLDLIAYGHLEYIYRKGGQATLQLPHPRTGERRFVLQPLYDLDPTLRLPGIGDVGTLLQGTQDQAAGICALEGASLLNRAAVDVRQLKA